MRATVAVVFVAAGVTLPGCQEETFKVSRGTNEIPKAKEAKTASRIEKARKAEEEILSKGGKLR